MGNALLKSTHTDRAVRVRRTRPGSQYAASCDGTSTRTRQGTAHLHTSGKDGWLTSKMITSPDTPFKDCGAGGSAEGLNNAY